MDVNISPYVVYRRSRLPLGALGGMSFTAAWSRIDELEGLREEIRHRAAGLADRLGEAVPTLGDDVRAPLIRVRRDVHNLRHDRVAARLEPLRPHLDAGLFAEVETWCALGLRAEQCEREGAAELEREKTQAADGFRELFEHDAMARSIQLSGDRLYRGLRDFVHGEDAAALKPSKARLRESSLVNFAYRASLKPSPFGRFTEIGAFPPDAPAAQASPDGPAPGESITRLNRLLVNWVLAAVPRVPGGLESGHLVLNSTLRAGAESIEFIGVAPGSREEGKIASETVLRVRRESLFNALLAAMPHGSAPATHVLRALGAVTGKDAVSREVVHGLIRAGTLFFRPEIDDHDPDYAAKFEETLAAGGTPETAVLRGHFAELRRLETDFAEAAATERQKLLDSAYAAIGGIAELCKVSPPPEDVLKSPVFEDTPASTAPQAWNLSSVQRSIPALTGLWRLASLMDNGQVKRLGLHAFATRVLGDRPSMPFIEFFQAFSSLSDQEQADVFMGRDVEAVGTFVTQRAEALRTIRERLVTADGAVHLDPSVIERACEGVDDLLHTESVTFRAQFAQGVLPDRDRTLVVNGLLTGYGVYFSRFGSFVGGTDDWSLPAAQRAHIDSRFPGQVDLNSVLGFNFNLHPPVTRRVVNYPGAVSLGGDRKVYTLDRLEVRSEPGTTSLRLWDPEAREFLDLVPMNFMTPVGVPLLYRLLEAMSPSNRYLWKPLEDIQDAGGPVAYSDTAPRLVVGDVVAERRSWNVAAADIPMLQDLSRDSFDAFVAFDALRRSRGLPRHAFVLCQTPEERDVMAGRSRKVTRQWADYAHLRRASVHKPMYVDFRNPFLVRSFAKSALSRGDVLVSIRECLPSVDDYGPDTGWTAAEEFFVELCTDK
ncbi:lantibiotic dehydratase family protein [Streptomyces sp. Je 1-79]|uniref:lantibiotic dehydratase family protein n=1 Tax=Streptomyces sp. Je 1-79 TaxID=2943847 RepID=UPI0021A658FC|nr:lantibiotic dehydratase family protein [Streptomyces sp. Je 1-79]MCT4355815.1 lantibiotic dehydratase family protein [Streptomyces sp. Je 1-79]